MQNKIKQKILQEAEGDYKKFSASLIPNINNVLGVRLPKLRAIAKDIYKTDNWQEYLAFSEVEFMEETMIQGMIIGQVKEKPEKILEYVKNFVPKIDNWAVCDSFCTGLKFANQNKELVWDFIQPYFYSKKEYDIRFGYVMILGYFVEEEYLDRIFKLTDEFKDCRYYAQMAVAWALSVCFVKFPDKTLDYLKVSHLDSFTFNKTLQKIRESYRVSKEMKDLLKAYRKC